MGRSLEEVLSSLSAERRERVKRRSAELIAEYEVMQHLKQLIETTDTEEIASLPDTSELKLSVLRRWVEELGGTVDVVVNLPGKSPLRL